MIKKEEVKKIAKLSRISLTEEEISSMQKEISSILDYFNILSELDVSGIEPFSFPYNNVGREDIPKRKKEGVDSFPHKKDNYLKVKEVF